MPIVYTPRKSPLPCTITPYADGDLRHIESIEQLAFAQYAWSRQRLSNAIHRDGNHCVLAVSPAQIVTGYMLHTSAAGVACVVNIAVHPGRQRQEVGTQLLDWLKDHMRQLAKRRWSIIAAINETAPWAVSASHFLKSQGIRGVGCSGRDKEIWDFECSPRTREDGWAKAEEVNF